MGTTLKIIVDNIGRYGANPIQDVAIQPLDVCVSLDDATQAGFTPSDLQVGVRYLFKGDMYEKKFDFANYNAQDTANLLNLTPTQKAIMLHYNENGKFSFRAILNLLNALQGVINNPAKIGVGAVNSDYIQVWSYFFILDQELNLKLRASAITGKSTLRNFLIFCDDNVIFRVKYGILPTQAKLIREDLAKLAVSQEALKELDADLASVFDNLNTKNEEALEALEASGDVLAPEMKVHWQSIQSALEKGFDY